MLSYTIMEALSYKHIGIGAIALFILAGVAYGTYPTAPTTPTAVAAPTPEVVLFSGVVEPQERITLAFEQSGRLTDVRYHRGDTVTRGAPLAVLETATARAELAQQEALIETERAQLTILVRGATVEEIALERAKVAQAETTVRTSTENLQTAIINAFTVSDNAVYTVADELFENPRTHVPEVRYTVPNNQLVISLENNRLTIEALFGTWSELVTPFISKQQQHLSDHRALFANAISSVRTEEPVDTAARARTSRTNTLTIRAFLEDLAAYAALLETGTSGATAANIATWRSNIGSARTGVQTALTNLDTALSAYESAQESLRVAEASLQKIQAPATAEDIRLQEAKVAAQQARVLASEAQLAKYTLRAPANGSIVESHKSTGELVTVGEPVFTIDAGGVYEIEGRVSELDIVRLAKGMHATVTFEALDNREFAATITQVDNAERTIGNDSGYGVTLQLVATDAPIKAGMTADVRVERYE